jgi:hypothetical protein
MKNVIIFGCPRSGTSLFLEMFETLGWRTYFEPGMDFVLQHVATDTIGPNDTKRPDEWAIKNPVDHYYTPGLTCQLPDLEKAFPDALKIWIMRHPLDTICSLRPGLEKRWAHQPYPPFWKELMTKPVDVRAAELWAYCNGIGFSSLKADLHIKYEDLLAFPERAAREVCLVAGRPGVEGDIAKFVKRVTNQSGVHEAAHQGQWTRSHATHIGRWDDEMTFAQYRMVRPIIKDLADKHGYDLTVKL